MSVSVSMLPPLCLARPNASAPPCPLAPQDIVGRMLHTRMALAPSPDEFLWQAVTILRRGFHLDFGAAYQVTLARPSFLALLATEDLPPEFDFIARGLPLPDYADIADLPFCGAHEGCCGDFFAPVAAAYAMQSWLFLSMTHPDTFAVRGSLLLGSRNPARFARADTVPLFALARSLSQQFDARFPFW